MNYITPEQIKEYVSKHPTGIAGNSKELSEMVNYFGRLIVAECCDWIEGSPTSESGCQLLLTKSFIIANIKGHFGV